ncbi:hypothetical protein, partial [Salmonella enterica]|uniref:hypothetical protein n=1 Tax=Salmonella enterica TaxID=28901 RepID=UPI001BAF82FD
MDIGQRQLTGLKDGTSSTDAATWGQVSTLNTATLKSATAYTDKMMAGMNGYTDNEVSKSEGRIRNR